MFEINVEWRKQKRFGKQMKMKKKSAKKLTDTKEKNLFETQICPATTTTKKNAQSQTLTYSYNQGRRREKKIKCTHTPFAFVSRLKRHCVHAAYTYKNSMKDYY